ncbi:helix-turn-helix domain-containing protein [Azonexus hydrophilus]|uniref:helix-turn-helix domain-containing protein n=1 Tax=Azonexus hydrophilus TaxID=418702 RepID=UPI002490F0BE|nr:helix-turn-helix domain-containing protein [Azonexus hydrophilus]
MSVEDLLAPWQTVNAALGLSGPVRDEAHHAELLAFVDEVFERFGNDDQHPIFTLVALVADRIREYEDRVHPWPDNSTPASRLAFLMGSHGLNQKDLPEVATQSVISEILSGKRQINLRQAAALAKRFGVPLELFAG